ncbi:MAG: hypothetical protein KME60_30195 [Cyanomargarita calcarea GSE-NOS-MK-12-04C]|jgi:hypothetical protein|uniref:ATP-dependent DNA helicase RecG C-terminal domain-containing protein n=1 Tax=Cyanomargarita calcarea GSE-NOS-MK-12-04C TaxID=2839659 RepID=A0A951QTF8_9CYAN|nr:hypothetical protein [Cyanomargarita calcarea GSE-NOS-MK-12-04C]
MLSEKKSPAKGKLDILLKLRNDVGHDLKGLNETSATTIINHKNPLATLEETLQGILPLCELPLFLVDTQKPIRRVMHVVRLLLMGEQSEPMPEEIAISDFFSDEKRLNGGTSTARNPLIARALKLIGFAELAGSGLREVYRVWNQAKRRPPIVETDEQHNRFRIELDSRPLEIIIDAFWKQRLGVNVTPEAAKILGLLSNSAAGMSLAEICSGTGADSNDLIIMCQGLQKQMLIDCETEVYKLKSHLLDLAREASKGNENNV